VAQKPRVKKTIRHTVKSGESLGLIANKYNVRIKDIQTLNKLKGSKIRIGQRLKISGKGTYIASAPVVRKSKYHTVKSGESLGLIASKNKVRVKDIQTWNKLKSSKIRVGQRLKLSGRNTTVAKASIKSKSNYHVVKPGESLGHIAIKYKVKVKDLQKWNGLKGAVNLSFLELYLKVPTATGSA